MTHTTTDTIEVVLTCDRETRGTYRFSTDAEVAVRTVYVSKSSLPAAVVGRTQVRVTVEPLNS